MRTARSRKLALWSALPPYLGGKRRLAPLIFREIDRLIPRRHWRGLTFLDGFLGGGSVSLYAEAQGFTVVATDIAERAITVGEALIANSRVRLTREDVLRLAKDDGEAPGRVETGYVPSTFTKDQARFLDRALGTAAQTPDTAKAALIRLLAIRVALLAHPMSQVRAGTIHRLSSGEYESITESCRYHYVDGLRLIRPGKLWDLAQQLNAGVFQGEGKVIHASILDVLPTVDAAVFYADPPYPGVMSYEKEYKVVDELLEGRSRPTSPFTARDGATMLDALFNRAQHIPVWLLSLGNAVVTIEELAAKMARFGRQTKAIAIRYQHLPAVATEEKKRENREFLVVGWDAEAPLLRRSSVQGDRAGTGIDQPDRLAIVEDDASLGGTELPTLKPSLGNGGEKSKASLAEKAASSLGLPVRVAQDSVDDPGAGVIEPGLDFDREGRAVVLPSHDPDVPLAGGAESSRTKEKRL